MGTPAIDRPVGHAQILELTNLYEFIPPALQSGFVPYFPEFDIGVDFILYRERDDLLLKVQQKSRWGVNKKYFGRSIWIAFPYLASGQVRKWHLAPHDLMVRYGYRRHGSTASWIQTGGYDNDRPSKETMNELSDFAVPEIFGAINSERVSKWASEFAAGWLGERQS